MSYNLREALWLASQGISDDIVVGYPSVDRLALTRLANDAVARRVITLMVDDPAHLDLIAEVDRGSDGQDPIEGLPRHRCRAVVGQQPDQAQTLPFARQTRHHSASAICSPTRPQGCRSDDL
ncbi:MAG: hypothetical protein R2709_03770 [Marmoricola sp.]